MSGAVRCAADRGFTRHSAWRVDGMLRPMRMRWGFACRPDTPVGRRNPCNSARRHCDSGFLSSV